jgi:GH25 family lysozyme M1 (1,4-beta-N-acetylmuramidase)
MKIYGIDTNHHHPVTNWPAVAEWLKNQNGGENPGFDIVRLGYSARSGKGGLILDRIALDSMAKCNALGIPLGVYVYCYDTTPAAAKLTMQHVLQAIKGYKLELPVVYDMEYGTNDGTANGYKYNNKANKANNTAIIKAAMSVVEAAGYYGVVYCSRDFFLNYTDLGAMGAYDKWEAAYTQADSAAVSNGIWQYSSAGVVPGITGNVDLNVAYKDYPAIIRAAGLNGLAPSAPADTENKVKYYKTTVGPMTGGDKAAVEETADNAGVPFETVEV